MKGVRKTLHQVARGILLPALVLGVTGWMAWHSAERIKPFQLATPKTLDPPPLVQLDPRMIDIVTLGHRGLYDDFINIWAIQILMDEAVRRESPDAVARTIRQITRNKPKLETLYMLSCFVLAIDFQRPDLCLPISLDGMAAFPDGWKIPVTQGAVFAFKMNRPAESVPFFLIASRKAGAPAYMGSLAKKLAAKGGVSLTRGSEDIEFLDALPGGNRLKESLLQEPSNVPENPLP